MNQQLQQLQSISPAMGRSESEPSVAVANNGVRSRGIMGDMTVNIDFDMTSYFFDLEADMPTMLAPSSFPSKPSSWSELFDARFMAVFFDEVHQWYPIFDQRSFEAEYLHASTLAFVPSTHSCSLLMVSAIGALALNLQNRGAVGDRCNKHAVHAFQMLHIVMSDHTLNGAQCLIFCAIYHLLCFKPIQAYEYLVSASYKMQNLYKCDQGHHVVVTELYRRAFYALYIMERELLVQLTLTDSGITACEDTVPLPSGTFESGNTDGDTGTIEFYLAEIAMQKIMERSDRNLVMNTIHRPQAGMRMEYNGAKFRFDSIVAKEMDFQIAEWRRHLPPTIVFPDVGFCSSALGLYLQIQYNAHMCAIYWHALCKATIMNDQSPSIVSACQKCLLSFCNFIDAAAELLSKPVMLPQVSMTLASIFSMSLAVIFVRTDQGSAGMGQQLEESLAKAVDVLRSYASIYAAVGQWADVLANKSGLEN
ncbi:hypothetical protein H2202_002928 [Exophiala xenobiotica]|nr:hypothetical protein H2202_002928 [Exophiala xenobiotica]